MRQKNGMLVGIFSLVICVIIVMGVMTPIVSDWTTGERTENEGAGWLRMNYTSSPSYQSIAADLSGEGVVIYNDHDGTPNGTETLSGTEDTIIYADNNLALWYENDTLFLLGQIDGEPVFVQRSDAISLIRGSDGIRVSATDTPSITFPFPTYAYEPRSDGNYAFFTNGTPVKTESGRPNAIVGGGFAGVYAYNNIFRYAGLGLGMETEYNEDGKLVNVSWDKITEEVNTETPEPLGAPYIRITHEDDIGDIDSVSSSESGGLRAVPTPTYTDGDWGYDLMDVDGITKAKIVSYSGTGGNLVIPSTVGGYDVYQIGNGSSTFLDNSTLSSHSTLTITPGPVVIGKHAFDNITKLVGDLVIPEGITTLEQQAFIGCKGFTSLTFPSTITTLGTEIFYYCSGLVSYSGIPEGITTIPQSMFRGCTRLTGELVIPDTITTIGQTAFSDCDFYGPLIIPDTVTSIGSGAFDYNRFDGTLYIGENITRLNASYKYNSFTGLIINSDLTPNNASAFDLGSQLTEVLDLSDTIDYSVNRYGIRADAVVSDSIGDCFGYISFVEIGSDPKLTGPIATLLIAVPLLMVVGLTIAAITMMRGRIQ